jgi:hypothetical protein
MNSDDPDEDADNLDDDNLLTGYIDPSRPQTETEAAIRVMDWPPRTTPDFNSNSNGSALAWFKANYADWQGEIDSVLRAWVYARTRGAPSTPARLALNPPMPSSELGD